MKKFRRLPDDEVLHNMSDEEKLQLFKDMKSPRKILENWHALPGIKHNGKIDKAAFEKWVIEVRQKAKAMRCIRGADGQLGELMARYPRNNDF